MRKKALTWISFCFVLLFSLFANGDLIQGQQPQGLPQLEGGSENKERVRYPISNYLLQERYPETVVLSGPQTSRMVALTFDDGPDPRFTPQILDILRENGIKATFFLLGSRAEAYPDLVKRIVEEGHIIGNHTYWHPNLVEEEDVRVLEREVSRTESGLANLIAYRTKLFRAPYGFLNNELVEQLRDMDYTVVAWSVDSLDWHESPPDQIAYNVLSNLHPGAIILMHDGAAWDEDRTNTVRALRQIIPAIKEQGFEFATVPELLNIPYRK
ncbi:polysaccharide deacetylase family protein [Robertmurraya sp. DFI.2.37]|uniref:polysaccharide deacetylase family protein n=1 Tax=Robertmurraya sp. DFI.2.37 TaxID=3031819 RepID=UPI001245E006|nr:polysaccharide deacetylase family protein [Robertmurraya sp. DFI.2.37]MDF1509584.1 polysaccharide deacetylase family protein [Robertmurraya sp. DFI.2.37]